MLKFLVGFILIVQPLPAFSAESDWISVGTTEDREFFLDRSSVRDTASGTKEAWLKQVLRQGPDFIQIKEILLKTEFDCSARRLRIVQGTAIFRDGRRDTRSDALPWDEASDASASGGKQLNLVCFGRI